MEKTFPQGWFSELSFNKNYAQSYKVKEVLFSEQSKFQHIEVLDTASVGKLLLLDGKTMVSDLDEFVYHECMAHVPAMVHEAPKKVLIIGGGDGGVVREFARYKTIEQIDLVEIDEMVIETAKKYFPHCAVALEDPRVNVLATDGVEYIKNHQNTYDIICVDSTDPEDFAEGLFKEDFYRQVYEALTENGIMTAQTENPFMDEYGIRDIYDNLRKVFPNVQSYWGPVSIYPGCFWTYAFASKKKKGTQLCAERIPIMQEIEKDLRWYNLNWHHNAAFALSTIHRNVTGVEI